MSTATTKRIFGIASKVLAWIIIAATALMVVFTIFSTLTFDKNERSFFGTRFYIVLSDSMSLSDLNKDDKVHFNAGDLVLIKKEKDNTVFEEGEVIAFISQNSENFGETVTHKIYSREVDEKGRLYYKTYGTNTGEIDEKEVYPEYVLGRYTGKLPKVGTFFGFLKTTPGYICCILIPFLLVIAWQGSGTIRLFMKYKREQAAIIEAEKAEIAAERKQNEEMLRELLALKAQMQQQQNQSAAESVENTDVGNDESKPENQ